MKNFTDLQILQIKEAKETFLSLRRPPPDIRDQVDLEVVINKNSVIIQEIRAFWKDPSTKSTMEIAKATYDGKTGKWNVYAKRANGKFQKYIPYPEVSSVEDFFILVHKDELNYFFG